MTKFTVMSDIHNEFGLLDLGEKYIGGVLLLAGDIGVATKEYSLKYFLDSACELFDEVIMIAGNHEHYHGDFNKSSDLIRQATAHLVNFEYLDNEVVNLHGVTVIGTTMWSAIDPVHWAAIARGMNDFNIIENFSVPVAVYQHERAVLFIQDALEKRQHDKCIVMTHHAPTMTCAEEYRGNILNSAYGSSLEYIMEEHKPNYWVHGHTHVSMQYKVGETQILCNPRGYCSLDENYDFNKNMSFEL